MKMFFKVINQISGFLFSLGESQWFCFYVYCPPLLSHLFCCGYLIDFSVVIGCLLVVIDIFTIGRNIELFLTVILN